MNPTPSIRRSRTQGLALARNDQESGLSVRAYCGRHKISRHVLKYWVAVACKAQKPAKFVPVTLAA